MRKLLYLAALLYPSEWRQRYGVEFDLLLDDVAPRWAIVWDVLQGGIKMQVKRSPVLLVAAAFGAAGALVAGVMALTTPDRFASKGRFRLDHPPAISEAGRREFRAPELFVTAFSRANLAGVIERNSLYTQERARGQLRLEESAERMRGDINIRRYPDSSRVFDVAFYHPDPHTAQQVTEDLLTQLAQSQDAISAKFQVIDPPDLPRTPAGPNREAMAGMGFGGGAMLGAIVALLLRRYPRSTGT